LFRRIVALWLVVLVLAPAVRGGDGKEKKYEPWPAGRWPFWEQYAAHFIGPQGRVIEGSEADRTTSEGQAYALFFALVGNDRLRFDLVLNWTQDNLAGGDLHKRLPAWKWGHGEDGKWRVLDDNSAADADLWMAYSLLEASRLWDEPEEYGELGKSLLSRIAAEEVADLPGQGPMLLPGRFGFHPVADQWIVNASYIPPPLLWAAARAQPDGPWKQINEQMETLVCQGSGSGFAMDWDIYTSGKGYAPTAGPGGSVASAANAPVPGGSYDAIRVYLWAGLSHNAGLSAAQQKRQHAGLDCLGGMATYLDTHATPPEVVDPSGKVLQPEGTVGFSAALLPYLQLEHRPTAFAAQHARLESHKNDVLGLYGENDPRYYDQNLTLFALGWSEQRLAFEPDGKLRVKWHAN
jgi:endoglucanase